jgi:hypothetical protein
MTQFRRLTRLLAAGLMLSGLTAGMFAQDQEDKQKDRNERDRMAATTLTGCLNKDAAGGYMLTDESTGTKTAVTGTPDLEKHSANHKVSLTGMTKTDASGNSVFQVTKITMVSATCKAP